ncbi:MAG: nucleoside monophosphate kinase, partial [Clostridia bacterium]|nr:nucleoside monophosphate kinase [Clostridia bacterium]
MKLIFLGPPGAGKGTQAAGVSAHLGVPHISTGDMFRSAIKNQTPTGLEAKRYMDAGELVPDSVTIAMVRERLSMDDCANGYLLDGFPRTVDQAIALDSISVPDAVVDIDVPDERLLSRLTGRRICGKCQGTFHISKLTDDKTCPVCGGELYQRNDDKPETISTRLKA